MTATKTNERPGTRAVHRYCGMSASKARQVLDLIRGQEVQRAAEILSGVEREAAEVIGKVLTSAVANAAHNDQQSPEDLYVSACYADEGATMKRWRPRARGRATRHPQADLPHHDHREPAPGRAARAAPPAHGGGQLATARSGSPLRGSRADQTGRLSRRRAARAEAERPQPKRPQQPRQKKRPPTRSRRPRSTVRTRRSRPARTTTRRPRRTPTRTWRTRVQMATTRARRVRASRWARR